MGITVVPILESHILSFRECLDVVAKEKRFLAMTEAPPPEQVREFVLALKKNDTPQFVAVDREQVIGWADAIPCWGQAAIHVGRLGIGLLPEYRGIGIGTRLLRSCIAKCWDAGLSRIELDVRTDNLRAIRLYERHGFIREGCKRQAMQIDGTYFDALIMSLLRSDDQSPNESLV